MEINEGALTFVFQDKFEAIKFDDTDFYRQNFNKLPGSKGVDFLAVDNDKLLMIEIKNCKGHEQENMWRTAKTKAEKIKDDRDCFDVEVSKKVAMTLACLAGAESYINNKDSAKELLPYCQALQENRDLKIMLFLEGEFKNASRNKKMIMKGIKGYIKNRLEWLNCHVSVVDSNTYKEKYFLIK